LEVCGDYSLLILSTEIIFIDEPKHSRLSTESATSVLPYDVWLQNPPEKFQRNEKCTEISEIRRFNKVRTFNE